jgi:hypothetical protein
MTTPPTASFSQPISQAIDHMQSRAYDRAISSFREVLSDVKAAIHSTTSEEPGSGHTHQDCHMSDITLELASLRDSFDANQTLYADQNAFSLYDRAIGILATEKQASMQCSKSNLIRQLQVSAVILYNIGLSFHLKALQNATKSQDRLLPKALRFYRVAVSLLQKSETCRNNFLRMALYNNMGHIHFLSLDRQSACRCMASLRQTLSAEMASNQTKSAEYAHFRINLIVLEGGGHSMLSASAA